MLSPWLKSLIHLIKKEIMRQIVFKKISGHKARPFLCDKLQSFVIDTSI
jgi:hypothetical protein